MLVGAKEQDGYARLHWGDGGRAAELASLAEVGGRDLIAMGSHCPQATRDWISCAQDLNYRYGCSAAPEFRFLISGKMVLALSCTAVLERIFCRATMTDAVVKEG